MKTPSSTQKPSGSDSAQRPNIIYFHTHDMGRWIEPYGIAVHTPNYKKLANEGLVFRKAFCAAPTCTPSRVAMLTGAAPHSSGCLGLAHRGFPMKKTDWHLSKWLAGNGYETILSGVQHEVKDAAGELGYEQVLVGTKKSGRERDLESTQKACEALHNRDASRPLFLFLGLFYPHRPFLDHGDRYNPDRMAPPYPVSDTPEGRLDFADFAESVALADECLGKLMETLKSCGMQENTILIVTTDHGPAFPEAKCRLTDSGSGVSLILRHPEMARPGQVTDALVSQIDIFPTLCDLAGLEKPNWLQGRSLVPVLNGDEESGNQEVFGEVSFHAAYEPMRSIRTERYKLIRRFDPERFRTVLANVDNGPEKSRLLKLDWADLPKEEFELFDLGTDPFETVNRAKEPQLRPLLEDLNARLEAWMRRTDDPLLDANGPLPIPPGARVDSLKAMFPGDRST